MDRRYSLIDPEKYLSAFFFFIITFPLKSLFRHFLPLIPPPFVWVVSIYLCFIHTKSKIFSLLRASICPLGESVTPIENLWLRGRNSCINRNSVLLLLLMFSFFLLSFLHQNFYYPFFGLKYFGKIARIIQVNIIPNAYIYQLLAPLYLPYLCLCV